MSVGVRKGICLLALVAQDPTLLQVMQPLTAPSSVWIPASDVLSSDMNTNAYE